MRDVRFKTVDVPETSIRLDGRELDCWFSLCIRIPLYDETNSPTLVQLDRLEQPQLYQSKLERKKKAKETHLFTIYPADFPFTKHIRKPLIRNPVLRENLHCPLINPVLLHILDLIQIIQRVELRFGSGRLSVSNSIPSCSHERRNVRSSTEVEVFRISTR